MRVVLLTLSSDPVSAVLDRCGEWFAVLRLAVMRRFTRELQS